MDGWFLDEYEQTVNMPTYLVAFIVSDFSAVTAPAALSNYTVKVIFDRLLQVLYYINENFMNFCGYEDLGASSDDQRCNWGVFSSSCR
jgi:hypothetical protein